MQDLCVNLSVYLPTSLSIYRSIYLSRSAKSSSITNPAGVASFVFSYFSFLMMSVFKSGTSTLHLVMVLHVTAHITLMRLCCSYLQGAKRNTPIGLAYQTRQSVSGWSLRRPGTIQNPSKSMMPTSSMSDSFLPHTHPGFRDESIISCWWSIFLKCATSPLAYRSHPCIA